MIFILFHRLVAVIMSHMTQGKKLTLIYFGTPDFSAQLLELLTQDVSLPIEIVGIVTRPDKKVGRKQIITPSPVKDYGQRHNIPVYYDWHELAQSPSVQPQFDLGLVFAYGKILPQPALDLARHGYWNLHPSLLPKYRGPTPVTAALLSGKAQTGVTIMQMDAQMDHGPIIAQSPSYIFPTWRRDQLTNHLVEQGADLLKILLRQYAQNMEKVPFITQDHTQATYCTLLKKEDGFVPWSELMRTDSSIMQQLFNRYRAYYPWPGIWSTVSIGSHAKRIKITKIHWENDMLVIKKVQLEGKNEVDFAQFLKAYPQVSEA